MAEEKADKEEEEVSEAIDLVEEVLVAEIDQAEDLVDSAEEAVEDPVDSAAEEDSRSRGQHRGRLLPRNRAGASLQANCCSHGD